MKTSLYSLRLTLSLVLAFCSCTAVTAADTPTQLLVGAWCTTDFQTSSITRFTVRSEGGVARVHVWGRCHPTECDWGENDAKLVTDDPKTLTVTFTKTHATTVLTISRQDDGSALIVGKTVFTDSSGRPAMRVSGSYSTSITHDWTDPKPKK
jgi:hypothetical protein